MESRLSIEGVLYKPKLDCRSSEGIVFIDFLHGRTLENIKWETKRPPYSPDLWPSDYHLFGSLKKALEWEKYKNDIPIEKFIGCLLDELVFKLLVFRNL